VVSTFEGVVADGGLNGGTARPRNVLVRLYRGETSFDFVGRRRWWYALSGVVILAGLLSLGVRGLNLGIDFRGGTAWEVLAPHVPVSTVQRTVQAAGVSEPVVEVLGGRTVEVQADLNRLAPTAKARVEARVKAALARLAHTRPAAVSTTDVGPTWGSDITRRAVEALLVFFVLVVVYLSLRFEWKMAIAAIVAVIHDLLVTAGIYSLTGFQVTPDTVIAVLTILGYSLYDTVVVFDRVNENARGLGSTGRMTYEDVVNLSMNQVLARSINTSLVAILPVVSVLVIGAEVLGATTLQNFGLALAIGLTSGAYSSIFIAAPLLASMKEREPRYATIRQRLESRAEREGLLTPKAAAAMLAAAQGAPLRAASARRARGGAAGPASGSTRLLSPRGAGLAGPRVALAEAQEAVDDREQDEAGPAPGVAAPPRPAVAGTSARSRASAAPRPRKPKRSKGRSHKGRRR
jgi:preprotein translocase subunit SecF